MNGLKSQGLSGHTAKTCCTRIARGVGLKIDKALGELAGLAESLERPDLPVRLALNPGVRLIPGITRFIQIPGGPQVFVAPSVGPLPVGTVELMPGTSLSLPEQSQTLAQAIQAVQRIVEIVTRASSEESCEKCVRSNLWRQTKRLRREKDPGRTRNPLNWLIRPKGRPRHQRPPRGRAPSRA